MLVVGIDVGGTHTKFGLVENGQIIKNMELGTNTFDIIRQLCNGAREIVQASNKSWEEVDGVAIGFPGMVINSIVMDSPNVSLQNCNLKEILEKELGKYVVVKNDAEMATLAEHKLGAGADCENMIMITLGTGVGGGIVTNRKLYVGAGGAGELGHILFEKNGHSCSCGRKGCAEQYVSMIALDRLAKDIMVGYPNTCVDFNGDGLIYASELAKAFKKNDACAIKIVEKYVDDLTEYLLDLCNIFRPNRIVIGGGFSHAPELIDMVARNCRRLDYGYKNSPKVDILVAQLGNKAGILGGYVSLEQELKESFIEEEEDANLDEKINSKNQDISLLDSISMRLDKPVKDLATFVDEDLSEVEQDETKGLYVNKFLDDITSEINTIKNEQLFESITVKDENKDSSFGVDLFNDIIESLDSTNEADDALKLDTDNLQLEEVQSDQADMVVEESESTLDNGVSIEESSGVKDSDLDNADTGITVDSLLASLMNTTANLNNAMSKVENTNFNKENVENSLTETSYPSDDEGFGNKVGLEDIFFGNSVIESSNQEPNFESSKGMDEYDDQEQFTEEEMHATEVVYDDNLLSRVNAMLTRKNQE